MRSRLYFLAGWMLSVSALVMNAQEQLEKSTQLPPPVELKATDVPNLQAAFDALPESGGIVHLPPGTTEIREPLVISTPEAGISGSGAATQISPRGYEKNKRSRLWRIQLDRDSYGITVSANNFCNSYIGEGQHRLPAKNPNNNPAIIDTGIDTGHGIVLENTKHVIISGNQFSGLDGPAVCSKGACEQILLSGISTEERKSPSFPLICHQRLKLWTRTT